MKISFDPPEDALATDFPEHGGAYVGSREVAPGVILDLDAEGRVIGMELLGVRQIQQEAIPAEAVRAAE